LDTRMQKCSTWNQGPIQTAADVNEAVERKRPKGPFPRTRACAVTSGESRSSVQTGLLLGANSGYRWRLTCWMVDIDNRVNRKARSSGACHGHSRFCCFFFDRLTVMSIQVEQDLLGGGCS